MARSPFQGTFVSSTRPTVVTAPDAIVYINGETEIMGCPSCRRRFDLNKYIVSVQADLSVDSTPGSCSISLSIPRHAVDDFYFDGKPILQPMMEVEVFAKGYYLVEGLPQYYPIFWGLITEVGDSYSSGEHTVSIQCSDILKWWELCKMNISPAFTQPSGQQGRSIFQNVYYGKNPYDVIWTLAQQSFGDVIVGTGSLVSMAAEERQQTTFTAAMQDLMRYWQSRFQRIRSNLLLYGTKGVAVRGDSLYETYRTGKAGKDTGAFASAAVKFANGGVDGGAMGFDPSDPEVTAFRTQFGQAGQVNFWQSEYQTKLELANAAKDAIGFEFFMDVTGDIVFKPPFYNLDTLSNKPVSWIQDIDIIDWDLSDSESEVVTQLILQGSFGGNVDYSMGEEVTPFTSVTDYHLLRQYGWRSQTFNSEFLGDTQLMFYTGMDMLDRMNARRHRGTVNIPLRPELRLGFPVYLAPKDQFWYVTGISHNIQFGGRAQTTLTLTARRSKFIAPHGIGKLKLTNYSPPVSKQNVSGPSTSVGDAKSVLMKELGQKGNTRAKQVAQDLVNAIKSGTAKGGGKPEPDKGGATGGAQPKPDPNAQITARQLSQYGTFSLKVGDAALMPGTPQPDKPVPENNPYAPVILRHPKTGRILGWPNVVMVYTRPYKVPPKVLAQQAGIKPNPSGRGITAAKLKQRTVQAEANLTRIANTNLDTKSDDLKKKYNLNRYSYGLNSAGVYIYAHDTSKKIQEFLLMPKSRIKNEETEAPTNLLSGDAGMIRPVSDDRGFEVIGHQRYGRGCALRDGSLVISETKDPNNTRANIGTQFALSGSLTDSLNAQSNGLTTIQTPYQNVADATARLTADDQETAAILDQDAPTYVPVDKTFVSTAPLGSPPQQGVPVSLEASQLSRALTLAEMAIRQNYLDQANNVDPKLQCTCLTGRSDLAFINVGYKVKTLKESAADVSGLPTGTAGAGSNSGMSDVSVSVAKSQQQYQDALVNNRPVSVNMMLSNTEELYALIENYLFGLYEALDSDHMEFEKTIRGEYLQQDKRTAQNIRTGTGPTPEDVFESPYGAPNRAALGDPQALLQQASNSIGQINSIAKKWSTFGDSIKASADKAYYSGKISTLDSEIARLKADQAKIQSSSTYAGIGKATANLLVTDPQKQLDYIQQQIDAKMQEKAGYELQLASAAAKAP
jgi:hypothetical protein